MNAHAPDDSAARAAQGGEGLEREGLTRWFLCSRPRGERGERGNRLAESNSPAVPAEAPSQGGKATLLADFPFLVVADTPQMTDWKFSVTVP